MPLWHTFNNKLLHVMMLHEFRNKKILRFIPLVSLVGLIFGAVGGYLYYAQIGCSSGSCAITSNPWMSTLWGAAMGYLLGDMFRAKENPATKSDAGQ